MIRTVHLPSRTCWCASRDAVSVETASSTALWNVNVVSVNRRFCVASLFKPHTNLSRSASSKCPPNSQCTANPLNTATYCATDSLSPWFHRWKRSAMISGFGEKCCLNVSLMSFKVFPPACPVHLDCGAILCNIVCYINICRTITTHVTSESQSYYLRVYLREPTTNNKR